MGGVAVTGKNHPDWQGAAPRRIVVVLGAYLPVQLLALYLWNSASQAFSMQEPADSTAALSLTAMAGVGLWLCTAAARSFPGGAPLRPVWLALALAAAAQAVPGIAAQWPGSGGTPNPPLRLAAAIAAGPVRLVLLAAALAAVLRILRKFGFWGRPAAIDWAVCAIAALLMLCRFAQCGAAALAATHVGVAEWTSAAGLPVLLALFVEATQLRQAVLRMGKGPVARCWSALAWGVFLTGLVEALRWLGPHSSGSPLAVVESLAQFAAAAVFALAPAYQLAAQRLAAGPAKSHGSIATELPAAAL